MSITKLWIVLALFAGVLVAHGQPGDTLTSSTPLSDNQTLTSAGGIFELGFFSPGNSSEWYLGIWYKEIPDQPIVWVANRDAPLNGSVRMLNLTADGNLLLLNKWSTNTSNATYPLLQLSDSGNLILTGGIPKSILWQSFDHPSDTFLPGMKIGLDFAAKLDRHLISWKSSSDPSPGNYSYRMDPHGVPEVYIWEGSSRTFRTGPWNGKGWSGRPDMWTNGVLRFHFVMNQHEVYYTFESLNKSVLCRAVIDESGVLQRLVWSTTSNRWDLFWLVPEDPCDQYATCGANGMCTTIYSPRCQCLQGFTPKSPKDWDLRENSDGCVRRTGLNCSTDGFFALQKVKLPDTSNASMESNKTLNECQDLCLKNCSCLACALNGESMCITWLSDLVDIRMFIEGGDDLYIRLAASELGKVMSSHSDGSKESELELRLFDMRSIKAATNDFSIDKILGVGGFGPVYKGQLEDGQVVAVKRLSKNSIQGIDEFKTEVMLIAKLQHRNLVRLLGCCIEDEERMLIYEYMQNTSLDAFIFDKRKSSLLNWQKRLDIIIGIARGLLYLHQDSRLRVIHRDLKASNILLDHEMNPKISDFGTARTFRAGQTEGNTRRIVGTCGYMSPEYAMGGLFSEKSDVFSFGVMLLEILSGKKSNVVLQADQRINLLGHAWRLWKQGRCLELLEESIGHSYPVSEVFRCFQVGLLCVQEGSEDRPTMGEVVLMLSSESVMLPQPNRPGFYVTRTSIEEGCSPSEITMTELEGR
ncbi:serine threonine-protein kinase [Musa troglodytarum]|uniref:Receptor-like serine/threonine-protein kinase n=1 Tax=Musa troglodytarum TaxID=320322 RepID=A0A9E7GX22_9LILI|nr:serine threonine-protein kinase [Musa troglodytarum]